MLRGRQRPPPRSRRACRLFARSAPPAPWEEEEEGRGMVLQRGDVRGGAPRHRPQHHSVPGPLPARGAGQQLPAAPLHGAAQPGPAQPGPARLGAGPRHLRRRGASLVPPPPQRPIRAGGTSVLRPGGAAHPRVPHPCTPHLRRSSFPCCSSPRSSFSPLLIPALLILASPHPRSPHPRSPHPCAHPRAPGRPRPRRPRCPPRR